MNPVELQSRAADLVAENERLKAELAEVKSKLVMHMDNAAKAVDQLERENASLRRARDAQVSDWEKSVKDNPPKRVC